jgi:type II secretory pathway component PulC
VKAPTRTENLTAEADAIEPLDFSKLANKKLQAPLFDAKPVQQPKTAATQPMRKTVTKPRLDIKLRGTVTTGDGIKAMLVTSANVSELLAPGESLSAPNQNVVVQEVTAEAVVLKRGPYTYSLKSSK